MRTLLAREMFVDDMCRVKPLFRNLSDLAWMRERRCMMGASMMKFGCQDVRADGRVATMNRWRLRRL